MLTVKDSLQDYTKVNYPELNNKGVFLDILVYSLLAYSYYFGNSELYTKFFKYLFAFLLLRYLFSILTNYTTKDTKDTKDKGDTKDKIYYQLNSTIGIFVLIIFLGNFDLNFITQIILVLSYATIASLINGYTTDNLLTVLVVYNLLQITI
jgi:L-asparagine transporter-like permease